MTSLGITLVPPHDVIPASPILASTGSFSTYPTRNFATLGIIVTRLTSELRRGHFGSATLCMSPHRSDHLILLVQEVWRMASEDFTTQFGAGIVIFPADCPHSTGCHFPKEVLGDTRMFQQLARFNN